jgi:tRNA C32,U32 (ribose-2'-O)-methylase TrmJ
MKIADGVCMTAEQITSTLEQASQILLEHGVYTSAWPAGMLKVRDWLRSRRTRRSADQAAMHYLSLLVSDISDRAEARRKAERE